MIPNWLFEKIRNRIFLGVAFFFIVIFLANINALVDHFLHPEIPYFDKEHLIVGAVYAIVSTFLFCFIYSFIFQLESALKQIKQYENLLPICSYCKMIRVDNSKPDDPISWKPIESFLFEKTEMQFSHGICPKCLKIENEKLILEETEELKNGQSHSEKC